MSEEWEREAARAQQVAGVIMGHRVHGTTRTWRAVGDIPGMACTISIGRLDDGQWYVQRSTHPAAGPYRARIYSSEDDALTVAQAVITEASERLGLEFAED